MKPITALIAEDEPLLAESLKCELAKTWPDLVVHAVVGDGQSAVALALERQPDVLFLDIQMPVMNGLEAAASLASSVPLEQVLPLFVFVTAFDQYAVQAFDNQAIDYVLKPVRPERLANTVTRLKDRLQERALVNPMDSYEQTAAQLRDLLLATTQKQARLQLIQASKTSASGSAIVMIPIDDVVYFEAADKYIRVFTESQEYLIRTPLKDLLAQLDLDVFWQVHRGTVVRVTAIESVHRDTQFKVTLKLRKRRETLAVSRLYGHLFKAM